MNFKSLVVSIIAAAVLLCTAADGLAVTVPVLGSAEDFAVLGHTAVTNTGPTVVFGSASPLANVGVWEVGANAISGFSLAGNTFVGPGTYSDGPGLVNAPAAIHGGSAVAQLARNDLITAYNALSSYGTATNLSGADLGNYNAGNLGALAPGVYNFDTSVGVTGTLELDAGGLDGVSWVFQIGTTLDTAAGPGASTVKLINPGGNLGSDVGVFWVVGTDATIGTYSTFEGNILALNSITINTGATIYNGRALAYNGAVTLDTNVISNICPSVFDDESGGLGSSSPNDGPGFSGGLGFDTVTGELVPVEVDSPGGPGVIPEPLTLGGLVFGLGALGSYLRRRKSAAGGF